METFSFQSFSKIEEFENELTSDYDTSVSINIENWRLNDIIAADSSEDELLPIDLLYSEDESKTRVFNLIARYLEMKDVKAAFSVSKQWNRLVSASEECMRKLLLKIDTTRDGNFNNFLSDVLKSQRCYANIEISLKNDKEIMKKVERILKKFAVSTINLKITKIGGFKSFLEKPLMLMNLEVLDLHVICGRACGKFLQNVCTLKKLTINGLNQTALLPILQQNPNLKSLELFENAFICYFNQNIALNIPFALKSLAVFDHLNSGLALEGEFRASFWNPKQRINFSKFLKSQQETLTSLHLDFCFVDDLNRIIQSLPHLDCLEVNAIEGNLINLRLDFNETITKFITTKKITGVLLFAIVTSCLNLQSMFIHKIQTSHFLFIVRFAVKLTNFGYFWATATEEIGNSIDLKALYESRVQANDDVVRDVKIQITKKENFL